MELLLAPGRREGLRLIREQLCCALCERIFEDPQCLDCKHNFCRACIFARLRSRESKCPTCGIPVFPSDVTRNQFLQSILVAWKALEHELALLEAHGTELGISVLDTDRALGGAAAAGGCASPPVSHGGGHTAAAVSTGAAIAAALVNTPIIGTPSRGAAAKNKWNVDTAAIRNEPQPPKQITGVAASPPRARVSGGATRAAPETPGLTQMTEMTEMTEMTQMMPSAATANGAAASPAPRIAHRRRNIFSPAQGLAAASSPGGEIESESESLSVMPTQELEGYLERIQMQSRVLSQWEQSRKRDASHRQQLSQSQDQNHAPKPRAKAQKTGTAAMEKLMKSWVASGSSQTDAKPAARSLAAAISREDDGDVDKEEDGDSQTEMLPGEYTDSPDLLANGASAFSRMTALGRSGGVGAGNQSRLTSVGVTAAAAGGLEAISSKTAKAAAANGHSAMSWSSSAASGRRPRGAASTAAAAAAANARRPSAGEEKSDDDDEEVEDSQLPGSVALQQDPELLQRRKKQRVSLDFAGAVTAFNASRAPQQPPERVLPVARIDSVTPVASRPAGSLVTRSRPPLPSAARQVVDDIRKASGFTLIATDLSAAECKRVSTACALLGGRFGLSFDLRRDPATGVLCSSVTHLVAKTVPSANGRRCKRTAKYMRALAEGSLVVDYAWVEASLAAGRWLSEERFEMVGDAYSSSVGKPRESHERRIATGRRHDLFQRFRFVLLCAEQEFDYQIDTLSSVVENFGGAVVSSAHFLRMSPERRAGKTHVGLVGRATAPADAKSKWQQNQIPIVRVAWLFECISHLEIVAYEDFYPYF